MTGIGHIVGNNAAFSVALYLSTTAIDACKLRCGSIERPEFVHRACSHAIGTAGTVSGAALGALIGSALLAPAVGAIIGGTAVGLAAPRIVRHLIAHVRNDVARRRTA